MKIKPEYKIRKSAGKNIIVSTKGMDFHGIMSVNDTGEFIWNMLVDGASFEAVVTALAKECDVAESEIYGDVDDFISRLKESDILE